MKAVKVFLLPIGIAARMKNGMTTQITTMVPTEANMHNIRSDNMSGIS